MGLVCIPTCMVDFCGTLVGKDTGLVPWIRARLPWRYQVAPPKCQRDRHNRNVTKHLSRT